MSITMVRSRVKPEHVEEADTAARKFFSAIEQAQLQGIRYASCKLPDGVTYVILTEIEEGIEDPRPTLPAYQEFVSQIPGWLAEPPTVEQLTIVGSYNLFGAHAVPV